VTALLRPGNRFPKLWLAAIVPTTVVFTHLILVHWHLLLDELPPGGSAVRNNARRLGKSMAQQMPRPGLRLSLAGWHWCFPPLTD